MKTRNDITELMNGFEQVCRSKGLRLTHQRSEIFYDLARYAGHPTAENVYNSVRKRLKTISLDTVYRTIATFEEYGLIKRVPFVGNTTRYDINLSVHHHLVCTRCKTIDDFYWPDFDRMSLPKTIGDWGKIDHKYVVINGLCSQCKKIKD